MARVFFLLKKVISYNNFMRIRIIAIGKIKEDYLKSGISEYLKRIKPYCQIEVVEVSDSPVKDNPNQGEIDHVKNEEGKRVLKFIKNSDFLINLDLNCKEFSSEEFAAFIEKKMEIAGAFLTFIIGGSYGLSDELKARANTSISLSKMTFLHQMTRLVLLEQIYRSFKILNNETYHK